MEQYEDPGFHTELPEQRNSFVTWRQDIMPWIIRRELSQSQPFHDTVSNNLRNKQISPVNEYFFRAFWASFDKPIKNRSARRGSQTQHSYFQRTKIILPKSNLKKALPLALCITSFGDTYRCNREQHKIIKQTNRTFVKLLKERY